MTSGNGIDTIAVMKVDHEMINIPWTEELENALLEKNWIIGTTNDESKVKNIIDHYCRSLPCDFVKSHPSTLQQKHVNKSIKSRILWQIKDIPYNGIPFCVVSHDVLKCTFSMDYHSKKRRKIAVCDERKCIDINESDDNSSSPLLCPAKIIVKKLNRYPTFALPFTATKRNKLDTLKSLRQEMDEGKIVDTDDLFWLRIPLASYHNHSFQGKDRTIHRGIVQLIKETVKKGITSPELIKDVINNHVTEKFLHHKNPPSLDDHAYYPSLQNINFVIYNAMHRKKGTYNESQIVGKRKFEENVTEANALVNDIELCAQSIEKPSTLEDVVRAFCSDTLPELDGTDTQSLVFTLREKIDREVSRMMEFVHTSEDPKRLEYILNFFNNIQFNGEFILNNESNVYDSVTIHVEQ